MIPASSLCKLPMMDDHPNSSLTEEFEETASAPSSSSKHSKKQSKQSSSTLRKRAQPAAAAAASSSFEIFVKMLSGKSVSLRVTAATPLSHLKLQLYDKLGVLPDQIRLLFQSKQLLGDDLPLSHFSIGPEAILFLITHLVPQQKQPDTENQAQEKEQAEQEQEQEKESEQEQVQETPPPPWFTLDHFDTPFFLFLLRLYGLCIPLRGRLLITRLLVWLLPYLLALRGFFIGRVASPAFRASFRALTAVSDFFTLHFSPLLRAASSNLRAAFSNLCALFRNAFDLLHPSWVSLTTALETRIFAPIRSLWTVFLATCRTVFESLSRYANRLRQGASYLLTRLSHLLDFIRTHIPQPLFPSHFYSAYLRPLALHCLNSRLANLLLSASRHIFASLRSALSAHWSNTLRPFLATHLERLCALLDRIAARPFLALLRALHSRVLSPCFSFLLLRPLRRMSEAWDWNAGPGFVPAGPAYDWASNVKVALIPAQRQSASGFPSLSAVYAMASGTEYKIALQNQTDYGFVAEIAIDEEKPFRVQIYMRACATIERFTEVPNRFRFVENPHMGPSDGLQSLIVVRLFSIVDIPRPKLSRRQRRANRRAQALNPSSSSSSSSSTATELPSIDEAGEEAVAQEELTIAGATELGSCSDRVMYPALSHPYQYIPIGEMKIGIISLN